MSGPSVINSNTTAQPVTTYSTPIPPAPPLNSGGGADLGSVIGGIAGIASSFMGGGGLGGFGALGGLGGGGFAQQMQLLQLQDQIQQRSARFQTLSNISKTEHDTRVNSIRNMRG